jgi:hypothetical protein
MMEYDYTIEALSLTFSKHADKADLQFQEDKNKYDWAKEPGAGFNVARALSVMCCEIERLKQIS